jgi:hypothetical protein
MDSERTVKNKSCSTPDHPVNKGAHQFIRVRNPTTVLTQPNYSISSITPSQHDFETKKIIINKRDVQTLSPIQALGMHKKSPTPTNFIMKRQENHDLVHVTSPDED